MASDKRGIPLKAGDQVEIAGKVVELVMGGAVVKVGNSSFLVPCNHCSKVASTTPHLPKSDPAEVQAAAEKGFYGK